MPDSYNAESILLKFSMGMLPLKPAARCHGLQSHAVGDRRHPILDALPMHCVWHMNTHCSKTLFGQWI